jgi:glycerophosphoryl diester phosphodiesterase
MNGLPPDFLRRPIAHRALHGPGRPENSRAAVRAAVEAGYGIEIDLQLSADGDAMVFHDYDLGRLTGARGAVGARRATDLECIALSGGDGEGIPTLAEVLEIVSGRAPLLIEIKDQDGLMGPNVGTLEAATVRALEGYEGPVAVMSFNPNSVERMAELAPDLPRGITTSAFDAEFWPNLPERVRDSLRDIPDFGSAGAHFVSHQAGDLDRPRVQDLRGRGVPVLCWTIRSPAEERAARRLADNITFEGYAAAIPA